MTMFPMAIATDANPGTSPALSLRLMIEHVLHLFGINARRSLAGRNNSCQASAVMGPDTHGSWKSVKTGTLLLDVESPGEPSYWLAET